MPCANSTKTTGSKQCCSCGAPKIHHRFSASLKNIRTCSSCSGVSGETRQVLPMATVPLVLQMATEKEMEYGLRAYWGSMPVELRKRLSEDTFDENMLQRFPLDATSCFREVSAWRWRAIAWRHRCEKKTHNPNKNSFPLPFFAPGVSSFSDETLESSLKAHKTPRQPHQGKREQYILPVIGVDPRERLLCGQLRV